MSGVKINNIVKRSISLSPLVNQWAEEMAAKRGFGTNFSAFLADLVRRAQESESAPQVLQDAPSFANAQKSDAALVAVVKSAAAAAKSEKPAKLYAARKPKSPPNRPKKSPPAAETK